MAGERIGENVAPTTVGPVVDGDELGGELAGERVGSPVGDCVVGWEVGDGVVVAQAPMRVMVPSLFGAQTFL